jgi:ABC-type bacteriocin/lantibiotic exporter with double-glycine peptidase domain
MPRLRHPLPTVSQQQALLPDGNRDPANQTDCGEACVSIIVEASGRGFMPPGCIREWLLLPPDNGVTTGFDLSDALHRFGIPARVHEVSDTAAEDKVRALAKSGGAAILLGSWIDPAFDHWMVTGRLSDNGVWVSDPWGGTIRDLSWDTFQAQYFGVMVTIRGR